jgi:hypothetical protein
VITAEVIAGGNERQTLEPLIDKAHRELAQAGVTDTVMSALADAGFWNTDQIARLTDRGIRTLVSPDAGKRKAPGLTRQRRKHYLEMRAQLATEEGKALYRQRQAIIEPVFAQTKHNRRIDRFQRSAERALRNSLPGKRSRRLRQTGLLVLGEGESVALGVVALCGRQKRASRKLGTDRRLQKSGLVLDSDRDQATRTLAVRAKQERLPSEPLGDRGMVDSVMFSPPARWAQPASDLIAWSA